MYGTAIAIAAAGGTVKAQTSETSELEQMKAKMENMETNMEVMQERIDELEKEKAQAAPPPTNSTASTPGAESSNTNLLYGPASPIEDRDALNNEQTAAPRPYNVIYRIRPPCARNALLRHLASHEL